MGYKLSRSAIYLRLLPKNSASIEGKKHITTAPVRLYKAQNDCHKDHPDGRFCTTSIRYVESLPSLLGPQEVAFLSQDDKARVPIGMTAAQKQSPMVMHVQYRIQLPDHDWVIAERHKLIPSVYAGIIIKPQGLGNPENVTYSGPTYIAIRSGKHDSSNPASHSTDFKRLLEIPEFDVVMKHNNLVKPIVIISTDGGPDENPRYPRVISHAIQHFKEFDLDAIFVVTNAPGRSAYNRVERRMAPLSSALAGLILRHDACGTHLDSNGKTIDEDLERNNFSNAGRTLANIWSDMIIDSHPVIAEYLQPVSNSGEPENTSDDWYFTHVRESQYFLQVSKCSNEECCKPLRSSLRLVLKNGFFPPPCLVIQSSEGNDSLIAVNNNDENEKAKFLPLFQRLSLLDLKIPIDNCTEMPYDYYCPSVQSQLSNRICLTCSRYFATKKRATSHMIAAKHSLRFLKKEKPISIEAEREDEALCILYDEKTKTENAQWILKRDIDDKGLPVSARTRSSAKALRSIPILNSPAEWLSNPWSYV